MLVAITGGTGTVGKKLIERHLSARDTVRVLSRRDAHDLPAAVEVHRGALDSDGAVLERFVQGAHVLYHCAAEIRDTRRMMEVNAHGTASLVGAAAGRIAHWVQLSSIAVYGAPRTGVIDEETPPQPLDVYGESKAEADRRVLEAAARGSFTCAVVRPSKVFGAGIASGNNEILYRLFALVRKGLFFFIGRPGALTHYVHIENLIDALERCGRAQLAGSRVYNLSDDRTIEQFVAVISGALGKPIPRLRLPQAPVEALARTFGRLPRFPLDERRVAALVNRATIATERIREVGYTCPTPVEKGLRELVVQWNGRT
jgi:nucleoside-diphosphate-sugar epimerase